MPCFVLRSTLPTDMEYIERTGQNFRYKRCMYVWEQEVWTNIVEILWDKIHKQQPVLKLYFRAFFELLNIQRTFLPTHISINEYQRRRVIEMKFSKFDCCDRPDESVRNCKLKRSLYRYTTTKYHLFGNYMHDTSKRKIPNKMIINDNKNKWDVRIDKQTNPKRIAKKNMQRYVSVFSFCRAPDLYTDSCPILLKHPVQNRIGKKENRYWYSFFVWNTCRLLRRSDADENYHLVALNFASLIHRYSTTVRI